MPISQRGARAIAAAALAIVPAASQTSSCGGSSSSSSGGSGAGGGIVNVCKAATEKAYPTGGKVVGFVKLTCPKTPDIFDLSVRLKWIAPGGDIRSQVIMDSCSQTYPEQMGTACTVTSACKAGEWLVTWSATVMIDGAPATNSDTTSYSTFLSADGCKWDAG